MCIRDRDYSDPEVKPIVQQWMNKNLMDKRPLTYQQGVDEDFDDASPHTSYVQSIRTLTNKDGDENYKHRVASLSTDKSGNQRVRALDTSREFGDELTINTDIPKGVRAKMVPQQGDADIDEGSVQDKLYQRHQELRKKRGAPDPEYYQELKKTYNMPDDERWARTAELKKKYGVNEAKQSAPQVTSSWEVAFKDGKKTVTKATHPKGSGPSNNSILASATLNNPTKQVVAVKQLNTPNSKTTKKTSVDSTGRFRWSDRDDSGTVQISEINEDSERYIEELGRAGYEIVTESATLCPECGGVAYENQILAEKQDACYHKVKSRYKVWPSAYASGALVRCRKKGAANWGNKSKK